MKSHDENRFVLCAICFNKTKEMRKITPQQEKIVQIFVPCYSVIESAYPASLCSSCRIVTNEYARGKYTRKISKVFDYTRIIRSSPRLGKTSAPCVCTICTIARANGKNQIFLSLKKKIGRRPLNSSRLKRSNVERVQICSKCFLEIAKGKPHRCYKKFQSRNLIKLTNLSSKKSKEKIVSAIIQENNDEKPSSSTSNTELAINSKKSSYNLILAETSNYDAKETLFSAEDFCEIQKQLNISTKKTLKLATCLRQTSLKKKINNKIVTTIESNIKTKLQQKLHDVHPFFTEKEAEFQELDEKGQQLTVKRSVIYCKCLKSFLKYVMETRELTFKDIQLLKVGIDGGGGFFKICLSILTSIITNKNTFKDSGVKKVFILCIVKDIKENYFNVNLLWNLLKINELETCYSIATDLKLANILVGIMSHSAAYPCTWCQADKQHLEERGELRSFQNIKNNSTNWKSNGGVQKNAKKYFNCIHNPIPHKDEDLIQIVPPPELHLLLGTINTIYLGLMKESPEICKQWTSYCHVEREALHGGSFNGNSCRKLLRHLDFLQENLPLNLLNYVKCLQAFEEVVETSFRVHLSENYEEKLQAFKSEYLKLGLRVTPKVHAVFFHVGEFCKLTNSGLGFYSEQASEAVHSDFKATWIRFKVNDSNPNFSKKLLAAVINYNSSHL